MITVGVAPGVRGFKASLTRPGKGRNWLALSEGGGGAYHVIERPEGVGGLETHRGIVGAEGRGVNVGDRLVG